jgi:Tol biopolymer transport system component/DNA-binding winged helix-turn-helix (wHTH) protein
LPTPDNHQLVRFGPFEINVLTEELRRDGRRIQLQSQPIRILSALLEKPGELVTREDLRRRLWPEDTFVDFEHGLNTAVRKLRQALEDDAEKPTYIETLPKRGYRFIAPLDGDPPSPPVSVANGPLPDPPAESTAQAATPRSRRRWPYLVGSAALVIVAIVGLLLVRFTHRPPAPVARQLVTLPGDSGCPSFSPDGERVTFLHNQFLANDDDLYVTSIPDGSLLKMTSQPGHYGCPHFSPDGKYLAFRQNKNDESGIYVMPAFGGSIGKLISLHPWSGGFDWSPDGKAIVYSDSDSPQSKRVLHRMNLETMQDSVIPTGDFEVCCPFYSPDGKWIGLGGMAGLALIPAGGGKLREFKNSANCGASWTSDSKEIVFTRYRNGPTVIWRLPIASGELKSAPGSISNGYLCNLTISLKGNRLAYVIQSGEMGTIYRLDLPTASNPHPGPPRVLIATTSKEEVGQISPDGKRIVFQSERTGQSEIWSAESDGSNQLQLSRSPSDGEYTGTPRWSPDGKWISYGHNGVYIMNATGGPLRKIGTCLGISSWSHDGKWIYCNGPPGAYQDSQIWKVSVENGEAHQITRNGGFNAFESSDGKYIYLTKWNTSGIFRVPVAGGPEVKVIDYPEAGAWAYWVLEDDGIYYIVKNTEEKSDIRYWLECFDFASRTSKRIAPIKQILLFAAPGFTISPDRSWMLYAGAERGTDTRLMMMENFR